MFSFKINMCEITECPPPFVVFGFEEVLVRFDKILQTEFNEYCNIVNIVYIWTTQHDRYKSTNEV